MAIRNLLVCALAASCISLCPSTADARRIAAAPVLVEILDAGPTVPACGDAQYVVAMRVRVIEGAARGGGPMAGAEVVVGVSCPEGALYRTGGRARMRLTRRRLWSHVSLTPNPDGSTPRPQWWALSVEPLPPPPG